jgi:hypothetical protein
MNNQSQKSNDQVTVIVKPRQERPVLIPVHL